MVEAPIRSVQQSKAIEARLDFQIRKQLAIHQEGVAERFRNPRSTGLPGDRIFQAAILLEEPVANYQRDLVFSARQREGVFYRIAHHVQSQHAGIDVQAIDAHGVIVIPEQSGLLPVGIAVGRALPARVPVLRIAVAFRRHFGAVDVDHGTHLGLVRFGAVQGVVNRQKMAFGEFVGPFDQRALAAAHFQGGAGKTASERPQACGRQVSVQAHFGFAHGEPVPGSPALGNGRARQRVHKASQRIRIE